MMHRNSPANTIIPASLASTHLRCAQPRKHNTLLSDGRTITPTRALPVLYWEVIIPSPYAPLSTNRANDPQPTTSSLCPKPELLKHPWNGSMGGQPPPFPPAGQSSRARVSVRHPRLVICSPLEHAGPAASFYVPPSSMYARTFE